MSGRETHSGDEALQPELLLDRDNITLGTAGRNGNEVHPSDARQGSSHVPCDVIGPENGIDRFLGPRRNDAGSSTFQNIECIVPCFTPGTAIATPKGECPVEELSVGDLVVTRDNGLQPIRWVGQRHLSFAELQVMPHLKPVLIEQGALGRGLPDRDTLVSPNHRMLIASDRTTLYFEENEVLVAAKHIVNARGVRAVDVLGVTYVHFMCARHEVVLANGAWTETFQPGDHSLGAMGNAQRNEIIEIFPDLSTPGGRDGYLAARKVLRRREAMLLEFHR